MKEVWVPLKSVESLFGHFYLNKTLWLENSLLLSFSSQSLQTDIEVIFEGNIGSFLYTEESLCHMIFKEASDRYNKDFDKKSSFLKIKNSKYLQKNSKVLAKKFNTSKFEHIRIFGGDEIVDIITDAEPKITIIKK